MPKPRVLIVEDNSLVSHAIRDMITEAGYEAEVAENGRLADKMVKTGKFPLVLLDMMLPDIPGEKLLKAWEKFAGLAVIVVTAHGEVSTAVECLKHGAVDFLVKPVDKERLLASLASARPADSVNTNAAAAPTAVAAPPENGAGASAGVPVNRAVDLVFSSGAMRRTVEIAALVAQSDFSSALITGESGAGKGMLARTMHKLSNRAARPLVEINCSALPATLIESELFGHKKGSFTDAKEDKVGLFEMANGGIVFLDEIGDMDVKLQTKLLKAIEDRSIRRVGDVQNIKIDVSIVAATNADLLALVKEGKFRLDLYHRLNVIPLHIEPLRQRREDIPLLIQHFLDIFSRKFRRKVTGFTPDAMARLMDYEWPGNVRELANVVERGCILTRSELIPEDYLLLPSSSAAPAPEAAQEEEIATLAQMEERLIRSAMRKAGGNKGDAAKILGLHRSTLYKKLEDLGLL
ncbi:MAG: hypothetical protein RL095_3760 [Verrucomicrobiota bacterium]|jgi:DNA-binding NtrC family response regulator